MACVAEGGAARKKSLNALGEMLLEAAALASIRKVKKDTLSVIRDRDKFVAFDWFGELLCHGVFVLYFDCHGVQSHATAIDAKGRCIYDKEQPTLLFLSAQALELVCSSGSGPLRITDAREVRGWGKRR